MAENRPTNLYIGFSRWNWGSDSRNAVYGKFSTLRPDILAFQGWLCQQLGFPTTVYGLHVNPCCFHEIHPFGNDIHPHGMSAWIRAVKDTDPDQLTIWVNLDRRETLKIIAHEALELARQKEGKTHPFDSTYDQIDLEIDEAAKKLLAEYEAETHG